MASYMADYGLNLAATELTERTLQVRLHDGAPSSMGTTNRIGSVSVDHPSSEFAAAASGVAATNVATAFGVLDAGNAQTVRAYTLWDGANFVGWADVYQPGTTTVGVAVAAGAAFNLASGQVRVRFTRP